MSFPDFRVPVAIEIDISRQICQRVRASVPFTQSGNQRADLSFVLIHIAIDHVESILALFEAGAISSGYALMRSALEAVYKSLWVATAAEEEEVTKAWAGRDVYGDFKKVIAAVEREHAATGWDAIVAKIKPHMRSLNENTHSGAQQTLRRLRSDDMRTPEFGLMEIINDIRTLSGALMIASSPYAAPEVIQAHHEFLREKHSWLVNQGKT